jgi:hypothetical protein
MQKIIRWLIQLVHGMRGGVKFVNRKICTTKYGSKNMTFGIAVPFPVPFP